MKYLGLNHWYIKDNNLSISLMNFYVEIESVVKDNILGYVLRVVCSEKEIKEIDLKFNSLEEAINFTEEVITDCWTFNEITNIYNGMYNEYGVRKVKKKSLWK